MNTNYFESIEAYLLDALSTEDRKAFDEALKTNSVLAQEVNTARLEHRAMQLSLRDDLKKQMDAWKSEKIILNAAHEQDTAPPKKKITLTRRIYLWASAAAVLLIIIFAANRLFVQNASDLNTFNKFYEAPDLSTRGNSDDTAPLNEAIGLMNKKNYSAAIEKLKSVNDEALKTPSLFLIAHCLYELKDYEGAMNIYKSVTTISNDLLTVQKAEWNLVLMHLVSGKKDAEYNTYLNKILADKSHTYYSKAMELKH